MDLGDAAFEMVYLVGDDLEVFSGAKVDHLEVVVYIFTVVNVTVVEVLDVVVGSM